MSRGLYPYYPGEDIERHLKKNLAAYETFPFTYTNITIKEEKPGRLASRFSWDRHLIAQTVGSAGGSAATGGDAVAPVGFVAAFPFRRRRSTASIGQGTPSRQAHKGVYLQAHYAEEVALQELAQKAGLSPWIDSSCQEPI
jgi:hypothetical protein